MKKPDVLERLGFVKSQQNGYDELADDCITEITQLREALTFYAMPESWERRDHYSTPSQDFPAWTDPSAAMDDNGKLARATLRRGE